jgi:hypothetical protein
MSKTYYRELYSGTSGRYWFGLSLLVAIIAAIALTMRRRPETKFQDPAEQIKVRRKDRVRLVQMDAEKRQ